MIAVYVAGPYRAANLWAVEQNIRRAEELAFRVWQLGAVPVTPHLLGRFTDKVFPDAHMLESAKDIMRRCDVVVVVDGWTNSQGTKEELVEATRVGIPVFTYEHLKTFLKGRGVMPPPMNYGV